MITDLVLQFDIDGIITTNTTLERENLRSKYKDELGGLSGRPLFIKSTKILAQFSKETRGQVPLIGVGGISSAEDAYIKIKAGASIVQLYSALIYNGFSLVEKILSELEQKIYVAGHNGLVGSAIVRELKKNGYKNIITATRNKLNLIDQNKVLKFLVEQLIPKIRLYLQDPPSKNEIREVLSILKLNAIDIVRKTEVSLIF